MKILTSRNYYELNCDAIPDNKIQQVVGTYTTQAYNETTESIDVNTMDNIRAGESNPQSLPALSAGEQSSTQVFENKFSDYSAYAEVDPSLEGWRTEEVFATKTVDIYNDTPMTYLSAEVYDIRGTRRQRIANTSGQWLTTLGWLVDFDSSRTKLYSIRNYNRDDGAPSRKEILAIDQSCVYIKETTIDSTYDGTVLYGNMYLLRITFKIRVLNAYQDFTITWDASDPGNPRISKAEGQVQVDITAGFKLNIVYGSWSTKELDFDYHVDEAGYQNYPLKITGNEYASDITYFGSIPWRQKIAQVLLSAYSVGKLWINAKVKASYLLENDVGIDTEVMVKDLSGDFISLEVEEDLYKIVFKVKNIEYNYSGESFYANVTLLEVGALNPLALERIVIYAEQIEIPVVDSNGSNVILGPDYTILEEEEE